MKRRLIIGLWFLSGALLAQSAEPTEKTIRFWGEVAQGLEYRKPIGRGLEFILMPLDEDPSGGLSGWTIQITPREKPSSPECKDYLPVITPPFRFWNHRYLSTEYAHTAQEAVGFSPREFSFVLNCDDCKTERDRVYRILWPYSYSKDDVDASLAKPMPPHGTGHLWIKDSKYSPGDKTANPVKLGEIHWIKFEVEIRFPEESKQDKKP